MAPKKQYAPTPDTSPCLNAADTKRVQEILGTLLYYARAVDSTMLTAIGTLASQQAKATQDTMIGLTQLLNYCATHPNATIRYTASDMILHVESDASYLSETKARSRAGGYHYLGNLPGSANANATSSNGAVNILCQIMREVLSSAAEAELAALFHNGKEACPIRITLEEMGHPQPPTPIVTDNSTAVGIANDTVKQKKPKQWTCVSTGYATESAKSNSTSTGRKGASIKLIILQNIIPPPTTKTSALPTFTRPTIRLGTTLNA